LTASQLQGLAAKHGFEVGVREDGQPTLRAIRPDAVLPDRVLWLFKRHRDKFVEYPEQESTLEPRTEWETCRVCSAEVGPDMTPGVMFVVCEKVGCPYKEPL